MKIKKGVDAVEEQIEEINLYDYYKVIVKRKNIIIFIVLLATILSFGISYLSPKVYESESMVRIPLMSVPETKLIIEGVNLEQIQITKRWIFCIFPPLKKR